MKNSNKNHAKKANKQGLLQSNQKVKERSIWRCWKVNFDYEYYYISKIIYNSFIQDAYQCFTLCS